MYKMIKITVIICFNTLKIEKLQKNIDNFDIIFETKNLLTST
jgi:hypothetical protein